MAGKIKVKFEPSGSKALIRAINELAKAQRKLERGQKKLAEGQHLVNMRVTSNTKGMGGQLSFMKRLQGQFAVLRNVLLLYAFGYQILAKTIGAVVGKYSEQEQAELKLEAAYGRNIGALKAYASTLQQKTRFGDEEIMAAQSLLAAYIKDEQSMKKATKAALDLAAAKGLDLRTAFDLVGKSIGSSTNALSRYGISVEGVIGSGTRLETLTTNINQLYGGQAEAQVDSVAGAWDQFSNALGDVAEVAGAYLAPAARATAGFLTDMISVPVSQQILEEKLALNALAVELQNANLVEEVRLGFIEEINAIQPSLLEGLQGESSEYAIIEQRLKEINSQYEKRIAIAVAEEQEIKLRKQQADLLGEVTDAHVHLIQHLNSADSQAGMDQLGITPEIQDQLRDLSLTFEERLQLFENHLAQVAAVGKNAGLVKDQYDLMFLSLDNPMPLNMGVLADWDAINLINAFADVADANDAATENAGIYTQQIINLKKKIQDLQKEIKNTTAQNTTIVKPVELQKGIDNMHNLNIAMIKYGESNKLHNSIEAKRLIITEKVRVINEKVAKGIVDQKSVEDDLIKLKTESLKIDAQEKAMKDKLVISSIQLQKADGELSALDAEANIIKEKKLQLSDKLDNKQITGTQYLIDYQKLQIQEAALNEKILNQQRQLTISNIESNGARGNENALTTRKLINDEKLKQLNEDLANNRISQTEYQIGKNKIDNESVAIKREEIEQTRALAISMEMLSAAQGSVTDATAATNVISLKKAAIEADYASGQITAMEMNAQLNDLKIEQANIDSRLLEITNAKAIADLKETQNNELKTASVLTAKTTAELELEIVDKQIEQIEAKIAADKLNLDLQTQLIDLELRRAELARETTDIIAGLSKSEIDRLVELGREVTKYVGQFSQGMQGLVAARKKSEMDALKNSSKYHKASAEERAEMEEEIEEKAFQSKLKYFYVDQSLKAAEVVMSTATGVARYLTKAPPNYVMAGIVGGLGAAQLGIIASTPAPSRAGQIPSSPGGTSNVGSLHQFAEGGLVGGYPHSQGGTVIEAERGEFVVSRHAVEAIGADALEQVNEGQSLGGLNITFNNPILTQEFVESELSEAIRIAVRRGVSFGIN